MKRKTSTIPTRIYSYGALAPAENAPEVERQLRQTARYYNCLVELENLRRAVFGELEVELSRDVAEAQAAHKTADEECKAHAQCIKEHRKATRARQVPVALTRERERLNALRKTAYAALKQAKTKHREQFDAPTTEFKRRVQKLCESSGMSGPQAVAKFNAQVLDSMLEEPEWSDAWKTVQTMERVISNTRKEARACCELPPSTYLLVEQSIDAARQKQRAGDLDRKWIPRNDEPCVDSSARVGVQLTPGLTVAELLAGHDSRLRIEIDTYRPPNAGKNWYKRNSRAVVAMRIGFDGREPIWARIPIIYHRALPDDAVIKWAWLVARRQGSRVVYEFQFVNESESYIDHGNEQRAECCAINLGWRYFEDYVRVAYVVGSDGWKSELRLPRNVSQPIEAHSASVRRCTRHDVVERLESVRYLQSICDGHFDAAKKVLGLFLERNNDAPGWLRQTAEHVSLWKNHAKMRSISAKLDAEHGCASLWLAWKEHREIDDLMATSSEIGAWATARGLTSPLSQLAMYLHIWSRKDAHLAEWIVNQRTRAIRHREQIYSDFARKIAERYQVVVFEDEGLQKRGKALPGSDDEQTSGFRAHKSIVAPGSVREAIAQRVGKARVAEVEATWNSVTCDSPLPDGRPCGHINSDFDGGKDHVMHCEIDLDSHVHDIDELNCRNQLRRYRERLSGEQAPEVSRNGDFDLNSAELDASYDNATPRKSPRSKSDKLTSRESIDNSL